MLMLAGPPADEIRNSHRGDQRIAASAAPCTVAATLVDEGKFGPAWVEGHNYKVVDGQTTRS
jgi:hypothetical protein